MEEANEIKKTKEKNTQKIINRRETKNKMRREEGGQEGKDDREVKKERRRE